MQQQFKVWNSDRTNRLCVIAANLNSLKQKAAEKLGYTIPVSQLRLLLESDGTLIDNDETLIRLAPLDLIFLLLKPNDKWIPPAIGVLKNTMCTIPEIITDALKKLELMDKPPLSWKLIDNKGNITVVLHWDHRNKQSLKTRKAISSTTTSNLFIEKCGGYSSNNSSRPNSGLGQWPYDMINTGFNKNQSNKKNDNLYRIPNLHSSQSKNKTNGLNVPQLGTINATSLPELLTAFDEDEEDISEEIINSTLIKELISPSQEFAKCDFHCASLHLNNLKKPNIVRSTATSPIPEFRNTPPPIISVTNEDNSRPISPASSLIKKPKDIQKQHVRFLDDQKNLEKDENNNKRFKQPSIPEADEEQTSNSQDDKAKTEAKKEKKISKTEENQEEILHERYLLLVDQISEDNESPLSIRDIGTILDKMGSKIVDVEKLEKEKENNKAHNWLIKATVKGEFIREMGVVYKGHYYGIVEHPGYF